MTSAFDEDALRNWLVDYLVTNIGCSPDEIDFDAPLNDLAVGSSDAVVLTGELSELLGRTVSPVEFWQYPTINALAQFLTGGGGRIRRRGARGARVRRGRRADRGDRARLPVPGRSRSRGHRGPDAFWQFLMDGRSAVREVPEDRWESFRSTVAGGAAALSGTTRWGCVPARHRRLRRRVLRDLAERGRQDGPAAAPAAGGRPRRRSSTPASRPDTLRHSQTGVFVGGLPRRVRVSGHRRPRRRSTPGPAPVAR